MPCCCCCWCCCCDCSWCWCCCCSIAEVVGDVLAEVTRVTWWLASCYALTSLSGYPGGDATCNMPYATCNMQQSTSKMQHSICNMQYGTCEMLFSFILYAICDLQYRGVFLRDPSLLLSEIDRWVSLRVSLSFFLEVHLWAPLWDWSLSVSQSFS